MTKLSTSALALASFLPLAALAQGTGNTASLDFFENLIEQVQNILGLLIPVIIGLGLVIFLWNLFGYMRKAGEDKKGHANGMLWGIIILAVMVAVWGLVRFAGDLVGIDVDDSSENRAPELPKLPGEA